MKTRALITRERVKLESAARRHWLNLVCFLLIGLCLVCLALLAGCSSTPVKRTPASSIPRAVAQPLADHAARAVGGAVHEISGASMLPVLGDDALAVTEPAPFATLRAGDLVVYRARTGTMVAHRLYEYSAGAWLALGDNNAALDHAPVTATTYAGRVWIIFYLQPQTP